MLSNFGQLVFLELLNRKYCPSHPFVKSRSTTLIRLSCVSCRKILALNTSLLAIQIEMIQCGSVVQKKLHFFLLVYIAFIILTYVLNKFSFGQVSVFIVISSIKVRSCGPRIQYKIPQTDLKSKNIGLQKLFLKFRNY